MASWRGKKRASEDLVTVPDDECHVASTSSLVRLASLLLLTPNPVRATAPLGIAKRAKTRDCPICGDHIPLRLLGQYFTLESARVQTILDHVGDLGAFSDPHSPPHAEYVRPLPYPDPHLTVNKSIARRRAASSQTSDASAIFVSRLTKTLSAIKCRRKARNMALRAATRDEDNPSLVGKGNARADAWEQCPVCMRDVEGDPDVVAAHVDACLAHTDLGLADDTDTDEDTLPDVDLEEREDSDDDVDLWEESKGPNGVRRLRPRGDSRAAAAAAVAPGFAVDDRTAQDVEDEIDVEGDDLSTFGATQFTEADVHAECGDECQHDCVVGLDVELEPTLSACLLFY